MRGKQGISADCQAATAEGQSSRLALKHHPTPRYGLTIFFSIFSVRTAGRLLSVQTICKHYVFPRSGRAFISILRRQCLLNIAPRLALHRCAPVTYLSMTRALVLCLYFLLSSGSRLDSMGTGRRHHAIGGRARVLAQNMARRVKEAYRITCKQRCGDIASAANGAGLLYGILCCRCAVSKLYIKRLSSACRRRRLCTLLLACGGVGVA